MITIEIFQGDSIPANKLQILTSDNPNVYKDLSDSNYVGEFNIRDETWTSKVSGAMTKSGDDMGFDFILTATNSALVDSAGTYTIAMQISNSVTDESFEKHIILKVVRPGVDND